MSLIVQDELEHFLRGDGVARPLGVFIDPVPSTVEWGKISAAYFLASEIWFRELRLLDEATIWTTNAAPSDPVPTREDLIAEMCRVMGPPPVLLEPREMPQPKPIRPPPFEPSNKPWVTRNRRNFKRSQKRR